MGYIYQIVNDINEKVYVGKTELTIEKRWKQHLRDSKKENIKNRPLYKAINKYGEEHFYISILEECNTKDLSEREIYWVDKLEAFTKGYNATQGGDGKHYINDDEILRLYFEGHSCTEIKRLLKYDMGSIKKVLTDNNITTQDIQKHSIEVTYLPVAKLDKDTLEILAVYSNSQKAEEFNGNTHHIADVCQKKRKTCKGYKWKHITKQEFNEFQREKII